jgi:hypothetical protein
MSIASLGLAFAASAPGPGEFALRSVHVLDTAALHALRNSEPDPAAIARLRTEAAPALEAPPAPLRRIAYEGRLNTDPARLAAVERLRVLDAVAAALELWQHGGDARVADALRAHVLAWARAYEPTGNDVNENKLAPLFVAALSLRESFSPAERATLDAWFARLGSLHAARLAEPSAADNRRAKRLRLVALFAEWSGEPAWRAAALDGFKDWVTRGLHADGTSHDLHKRDALSYHVSAMESALELLHSLGSAEEAAALYAWESPSGASLRRSVHFVAPYATGEKTRAEWTRSRAGIDRERAAAGIAAYQPGTLYHGPDALPMLRLAARFDPALLPRLR